jgi:hypothetical protein
LSFLLVVLFALSDLAFPGDNSRPRSRSWAIIQTYLTPPRNLPVAPVDGNHVCKKGSQQKANGQSQFHSHNRPLSSQTPSPFEIALSSGLRPRVGLPLWDIWPIEMPPASASIVVICVLFGLSTVPVQ